MDEAARNKLWSEYSRTRSTALRDQLIIEYSQLVKLVAGRLGMYLGQLINLTVTRMLSLRLMQA